MKKIFSLLSKRRHNQSSYQQLIDFSYPDIVLREKPTHPAPHILVICITLFLISIIVWSYTGELDIVATAPGKIVVSEKTKALQFSESGIIHSVNVRDGDRVEKGQLLVDLTDTLLNAETTRIKQLLNSARNDVYISEMLLKTINQDADLTSLIPVIFNVLEVGSQNRLITQREDIIAQARKLKAELAIRKAEVKTIEDDISRFYEILPIAQKRENDLKDLTQQGFFSSHAALDRTVERIELEKSLAMSKSRLGVAIAAVDESLQAQQVFYSNTKNSIQERYIDAQEKVAELEQESKKAEFRLKTTKLVSPVAGTVQQLSQIAPGSFANAGQVLMIIVPFTDEITVNAELDAKDIGFVSIGQIVQIKLDTFPHTRYGTLRGNVKSISRDATFTSDGRPIFSLEIALQRKLISIGQHEVPLSPGMTLSAEIITGKRKIKEYVFDPIFKTTSSALRER